ncbi:MAG: MgtC/SapB family protein [Acutalibacter sp.]
MIALPQVLDSVSAYLQELNVVTILFRLVLAMGLGGMLGIERGKKGQPAGFRTYITVCVASSLVTLTGQYIYARFHTGDPARLGAQVISGIGFLGAGTILVTRKIQVKGLTTAACLWASACIGLAVGIGFYWGAVFCTVLIYLGMTIMQRLERRVVETSPDMTFIAEFDSSKSLGKFIRTLREQEFTIDDVQLNKTDTPKGKGVSAIFRVRTGQHSPHTQIIETLSAFEGVQFIEKIR